MTFNDLVYEIAIKFIHSWNEGNFEALHSMMNEQITFQSPFLSLITNGESNSKLMTKNELLSYLKKAHGSNTTIKLNANNITFSKEGRNIFFETTIVETEIKFYAEFKLNEYGKLIHLNINYDNLDNLKEIANRIS